MTKYSLAFFFLMAQMVMWAQTMKIDGDFTDWMDDQLLLQDDVGDGRSNSVDFERLWVSDDELFVYIHIEMGREIELQEFSDLLLYIDIDNDVTTGLGGPNMGADFGYDFGDRDGFVFINNNFFSISHDEISLVTLPTVSSDRFEISFSKTLNYFNASVELNNEIKIAFADLESTGDRLPNNGFVSYTMSNDPYTPPSFTLTRDATADIRILSYNVLQDGIFESDRQPAFTRILRALKADIICFQEIYDRSSLQVAQLMEVIDPSQPDEQWYHSIAQPDVILVSRYPITRRIASDGNGIFEVDIDGEKIIVVGAHLPCCNNDDDRQLEVDRLMSILRNSIAGATTINIAPETPIFILGDMNLVGDQQQQISLVTGDIVAESLYGPDFNPDWDGTALEDTRMFATGLPHATTWLNPFGSFSAGRLDYILYTGSVVEVPNQFALKTGSLSPTLLTDFNLESDDVETASDHYPCVVDVNLNPESSITTLGNESNELTVYPNPSSDQLYCELPQDEQPVLIELRHISGHSVHVKSWIIADDNSVQLNVVNLPVGLYFVSIRTEKKNFHGVFVRN